MDAPPALLTVDQVALMLQVSPSTVYRLVKQGALACRSIGRAKRFTSEDVASYVEHVKQVATS